MLQKILRYAFVFIGIIIAIPSTQYLLNSTNYLELIPVHSQAVDYIVMMAAFAIIFYLIFPVIVRIMQAITSKVEENLNQVRLIDIWTSVVGLILGLLLAMLISTAFYQIPILWVRLVLSIPTYLLLGYMGFMIPYKRADELNAIIQKNRAARTAEKEQLPSKKSYKKKDYTAPKLLDTSVIIDGRIGDLVKTGFLEGTLLIPVYVLNELQTISDSADDLKRSKGRRGLDIINQMQEDNKANIIILEEDYDDLNDVDSKLVRMAKNNGWKILTNDFNLNKVATVQGVSVLNINELSNAVKTVVLPGKEMNVLLIKNGKEQDQAVGYLEDGTMIVVENGRDQIGRQVDVLVTSVLQTSAGRMIFAKVKNGSQGRQNGSQGRQNGSQNRQNSRQSH